MSIIQISKIQQRSGNLVDLPQLDEAEFGWASDAKRLFIGKTTPNENIEVLTSYSQINYSQINGSVGNLNISNVTVADGQVLTYDGNNWVNRGGDVGGLITLGDVSNVKITGGAIGYVLETDGLGNLSWTPKSSIIAFIQNVTQANPAVVTTTQDNFLTDGMEITITNASGMTQLNGNTYYANVLTSNTFSLYSDPSLTTTVNSTGFGQYSYTTATSTSASTNRVTIGNSALFNVNQEVLFLGDLSTSGLENNVSYYVKTKPSSTTITVSEELLANGTAGNTKVLTTATLTGANVYAAGGRAIASVSSGGGGNAAAGSNTTVQFNNSNLLDGDADFTWNFGASPKVLGIIGNANVGNLNASGIVTSSRLISNIATGTAPLAVTSTTRVANLNVSHSNVSDFEAVTTQNSGTFYPVFVNGATSANYALGSNANISFNAATGNLSVTLLNVTGNANTGNLGTTTLIATTGNITTINSGLLQNGNSNVTITANANVTINAVGGARIIATATGANVTGTLGVSGNANVGNLGTAQVLATANVTAPQLISNVATGTAPLTVTSTTRVANLNVDYANVADFIGVAAGTGNNFLIFANAATGNVAELTSTGLTANLSNNSITATTFVGALSGAATSATTAGTVTTAAQPNITSVGTLTSLGVNGTVTAVAFTANTGVFTGNGSGLSAIAGANVTGAVAFATTANAVAGANVSGAVAFATTANAVAGANVSGAVAFATTANAVAGANVSGTVSQATTVMGATQNNITTLGALTTLSTGANTTSGSITGNWTLTTGSRMQATYADLAEYYEADDIYEPGTVLMFGGEKEVTIADDGTSKVAGVVSTNPAYVMNSTCPGLLTAIALQGRVPCKVRGKISKGDMLISGGNGFARPNQFPSMGTVIGKALQDFDGYEGVIEVAVGRL